MDKAQLNALNFLTQICRQQLQSKLKRQIKIPHVCSAKVGNQFLCRYRLHFSFMIIHGRTLTMQLPVENRDFTDGQMHICYQILNGPQKIYLRRQWSSFKRCLLQIVPRLHIIPIHISSTDFQQKKEHPALGLLKDIDDVSLERERETEEL